MALGHNDFNELLSATVQKIEKQLVDNVLTAHPTLDFLKANVKSATGPAVALPIVAADDTSTSFTDASGSFSTGVSSDILGIAKYEWASPLVSKVRVEFKQLEMNSGPEQVVSLAKAHLDAAVKGHGKKIAVTLHTLNGDEEAGSFLTLDQIIDDQVAVGGIDPSTATYWKSTVNYIPAAGAGSMDIRAAFRKTSDDIYVASGERVNAIICGRDVFTEYEASFDDKIRYTGVNGSAESRFRELDFEGIPVRLDPDAPADRAYFINTDYLVARYLGGNFMKAMPAQTITGTLDSVTPLASVVTVGTNNRRAHGKLLRFAD